MASDVGCTTLLMDLMPLNETFKTGKFDVRYILLTTKMFTRIFLLSVEKIIHLHVWITTNSFINHIFHSHLALPFNRINFSLRAVAASKWLQCLEIRKLSSCHRQKESLELAWLPKLWWKAAMWFSVATTNNGVDVKTKGSQAKSPWF